MTTQKDPQLQKMQAAIDRLEKVVSVLNLRLSKVEAENKRLRGAVGRANNQIGHVERLTMKK
jgi:hypothetical protein